VAIRSAEVQVLEAHELQHVAREQFRHETVRLDLAVVRLQPAYDDAFSTAYQGSRE
jgi:hypothetical protein